jgi:hypothetical protein
MIPWSQDYVCSPCQIRFNLVVEKSERDQPQGCPECGAPAAPTFSVPKNLRVSFHDGVKRKGFQEGRIASELQSEAYNHAPGTPERNQLLGEAKKLNEVKK